MTVTRAGTLIAVLAILGSLLQVRRTTTGRTRQEMILFVGMDFRLLVFIQRIAAALADVLVKR
jgi:hypothetical protein